MTNDAFEYFSSWNKSAIDAIKKITETNVRISEKLMNEQMNLAKSVAADSAKMVEAISACKDPKEALSKQAAMAEEAGKQIMKSARSCADVLAEASQTYTVLFEENIEAANKATKGAASAVSAASKKAA